MGLDFSHGDAHWAYSGFGRFRERLAATVGIPLLRMRGFCKYGDGEGIEWPVSDEPLLILLHHSDCDGELTPDECRKIARRLRDVVEFWNDVMHPGQDYDRANALKLADGMDSAAKENLPLKFF